MLHICTLFSLYVKFSMNYCRNSMLTSSFSFSMNFSLSISVSLSTRSSFWISSCFLFTISLLDFRINSRSCLIASLSFPNWFSLSSTSWVNALYRRIRFSISFVTFTTFFLFWEWLFWYLRIKINRLAIFLFSSACLSKIIWVLFSSLFKTAGECSIWLVKLFCDGLFSMLSTRLFVDALGRLSLVPF